MRRFSCTVAVRYRPTMACTNSCRAPALILGIVPPFVCHAPVANFVRQRDPPGNKSGDAMRSLATTTSCFRSWPSFVSAGVRVVSVADHLDSDDDEATLGIQIRGIF